MTSADPRVLAFAIHGPIGRDDLPGLCDRVCALLERSAADVAHCALKQGMRTLRQDGIDRKRGASHDV